MSVTFLQREAGSCPARDEGQVLTVLVGNNPILLAGLQQMLEGTRFQVQEELEQRLGSGRSFGRMPGLIVVDAARFAERTISLVEDLRSEYPDGRIVLLADRFEPDFVGQAHRAGADGFCLTSTDGTVLAAALELVMRGEVVFPSTFVLSLLSAGPALRELERSATLGSAGDSSDMHRLSGREAEILRRLMEGAPNKVIARKLGLAEATVKVHVKAILRKIGVQNRTQAAMWAASRDLSALQAEASPLSAPLETAG
ncbi:LuxR C-terminal-related transcriptional regulator [Microvirga thermotolerans]|uniref:HTH luxR-type domain-containing protein n=1 Tax=Microvirga thermotolerans TaxID=2651334 RepID=A0A5P9JY34_9HYPH|nr:response regulator transcription factor [Microvirga thermotolerans]QFU16320.1 hypothetical protein GDR74_08825 [Microvirga thermotolerans]